MANSETRSREKCCRQCFAYVSADARKCRFCGYKFKSSSQYLFDKFKQALNINRAYSIRRSKSADARNNFLTAREIEYLLGNENRRILMYLVLDDVVFLDETSLIQIGETLSSMSEI